VYQCAAFIKQESKELLLFTAKAPRMMRKHYFLGSSSHLKSCISPTKQVV